MHLGHFVHLCIVSFDLKFHLDHHVQVLIRDLRDGVLRSVLYLSVCDVLDMVEWQFLICNDISIRIIFLPSIEFKHWFTEACLCVRLRLNLIYSHMT